MGSRQNAAVLRKMPPLPAVRYVVALYDLAAQDPGDLDFKAGDWIEVEGGTNSNAENWQMGRLNGRRGLFPRTCQRRICGGLTSFRLTLRCP